MKFLRMLALFAISGAVATAADLSAERFWTGTNGKTFRGTFVKLSGDRQTVDFLTAEGKVVRVNFSNLCLGDQELLVPPSKAPAAVPETPMGDKAAFKPESPVSRRLISIIPPKDYAGVTGYTDVDTLWISMLWWDATGVLELPKAGDLSRKAEWLHKKLFRHIVKDTGKLSGWDGCEKGLQSFFEEELKELAVCRIYRERKDFSVARLSSFTQGANAVVLELSRKSTEGTRYSILAIVESLTEDGTFAIHAFGKRFTGKIKPLEHGGGEFVLENRSDLPERITAGDAKFILGKSGTCEVFVVKPYVFATKGASSFPPPDDAFNFGRSPSAPPEKSAANQGSFIE